MNTVDEVQNLDGTFIENVNNFKYLGSTLVMDRYTEMEMGGRMQCG